MSTDLVHVQGMFKTNTDVVKRATEEISNDHWLLKPGEDSNHLLWVMGHITATRGTIVKLLGKEWTAPWSSLFSRGAKPLPTDQYPAVEEIKSAWDDVSAQLSTALANPANGVLAKPAPQALLSFDGNVSGTIAFLAYHETYHVGQVSYLRKWLGYGQTVG